MSTRLIPVVAASLLIAAIAPAPLRGAGGADKPNIVLILCDDLGIGDPSCYNPDSKIDMPHVNALAKQGVRFTDMHSPSSVCTPTRYGLLTGRYAWRTRLKSGVFQGYDPVLIDNDRMTIASLLKKHGYDVRPLKQGYEELVEAGFPKAPK